MKKIKPIKVSVIIPTWDRKDYLSACLKSIWDQKYDQLEVVIVDDGSTDGTEDYVRYLQLRHPNIQYVKHSSKLGISAGRNTGVKAARGRYVAFLDSDDVWLPGKLSKQMDVFESRPEVDFIFTNGFYKNQDTYVSTLPLSSGIIPSGQDRWPLRDICPEPSGWAFKRNVFKKAKSFDETLVREGDGDFFIRVANNHTIYYLNEPLFFMASPNDSSGTDVYLAWKEKLFEKHKSLAMRDKAYYWAYLKTMAKDYSRLGERNKSREYYLKAVKAFPWKLPIYFKLLRSYRPFLRS